MKQLVPGTIVLAQISKINSFELVLSLPNSLSGFVPITNISKKFSAALDDAAADSDEEENSDEDKMPDLAKCFKLGQWLRALIVSTTTDDNKKKLELSIDPDQVNEPIDSADIVPGITVQGAISSIEDHGLVIDFGNSKISGFISKKELGFANVNLDTARPGQVLLLTILSKSTNGRTVTLTGSPLVKKVPVIETIKSVKSITAGVLVEGKIIEVRGSGLVLRLYGHLTGTIDRFHAGHNDATAALDTIYTEGDTLKARVISTLPHLDENQIALSVLPHVMGLNVETLSAAEAFPVGFTVENAKVLSVDSNLGVFLSVGVDGTMGFAHRNRLSDDPITVLSSEGKYAVDTVHRARVIAYSYIDNMYTLSLEESVLKRQYLRVQDIPVGEIANVTVTGFMPKGEILVSLTDELKGMIPILHISDVKLVAPEKKYKVGTQIKAKVSVFLIALLQIKTNKLLGSAC